MQRLVFKHLDGKYSSVQKPVIAGVVASGNLEILIEPSPHSGACTFEVNTSVTGFDATWKAVVADFHQAWLFTDTKVSINDMGATPAVVRLRLDQAAELVATSKSSKLGG
ncbi:malonate decarboxylase acyl carrier protein [Noviherbaspirillum saxi]|uniref:Malonate decarboxylase acyl carrier protein n=1 Tax=Noviherbaspirillum saxi TaxID=2320863 RepID=A0A3A3FLW3_9BURK|nr:malonate decarboxylase acyl carrier protein [Noviherbaspirillum saxi]RJF95711.1 malonate decarboxylase acyl carrier protein [Noviherbaspirillum saxi]